MKDCTAASCAKVFLAGWVARFGVPLELTSDRGRQFLSGLWKAMATTLGTTLHHKTAYHPNSNGLVERFHRSMKDFLKTHLSCRDWTSQLPWVMLGLRSAHKDELGRSPAELVYGDRVMLPGELM
jgi:transposase InsO family protein